MIDFLVLSCIFPYFINDNPFLSLINNEKFASNFDKIAVVNIPKGIMIMTVEHDRKFQDNKDGLKILIAAIEN